LLSETLQHPHIDGDIQLNEESCPATQAVLSISLKQADELFLEEIARR